MYLLAEKESNLVFSPVLDPWIEKFWAQGLKSQRLDFEVYINLEDNEEVVETLLIWISYQAFIFLNLLNI